MAPPDKTHLGGTEQSLLKTETEFERLSRILSEKELALATLENEHSAFEELYASTVGFLIAELDVLEREIARELLRLHPEKQYQQNFDKAEKKARASQEAVNEKIKQGKKQAYIPTDEIKNLFRKVAKTIHPDLAVNEAERAFRNDLMVRANAAYKIGDKQALEKILEEWKHRDEKAFIPEEALTESEQMERKISQIKNRIKEIETRIKALKNSDLYKLKQKVERAARDGSDLLAEMAKDLKNQILGAKKLLDSLKQQM